MKLARKHKEDSVIQDNQIRSDKQADDAQDASHDIQNVVFIASVFNSVFFSFTHLQDLSNEET